MKKSVIGALGVMAVAMLAVALSTATDTARAATLSFDVALAGANEVPAVSSGGSGQASFVFDTDSNVLTYVVQVRGIAQDQVTAAHIHRGGAGENGDIAYTLSDTGFLQITGSVELSAEDVDALFTGGLYVNVHSEDNPAGFARGQLVPPEGSAPADAEEEDTTTTPEGGPTVVPGEPGAVTPPNTGDGGLASGSGNSALIAGAILLALLGTASGAVVLRGRA